MLEKESFKRGKLRKDLYDVFATPEDYKKFLYDYENDTFDMVEVSKRVDVILTAQKMMQLPGTHPKYVTRHQAESNVLAHLQNNIDLISSTIASQKQRFIDNDCINSWTGYIKEVTYEEILEFDLIYELDSFTPYNKNDDGLRYNRKNIFKLAQTFRKREGLSLKLSLSHAWFWSRRLLFDLRPPVHSLQNWINKKRRYEMTAEINRRLNKLPMRLEWHKYNEFFKQDKKVWESLKSSCELSAPTKEIPHWNVNVGNTFIHSKYGECKIVRHLKPKNRAWCAEYQLLNQMGKHPIGKKFILELETLWLEIFIRWEVKHVDNEQIKSWKTEPKYRPPMWM